MSNIARSWNACYASKYHPLISTHFDIIMLETYNTIIKLVVQWISHAVQALSILCTKQIFRFGGLDLSTFPFRSIEFPIVNQCTVVDFADFLNLQFWNNAIDSACTASEIHRRTNLMIVLCVSNIYRSISWVMDDISKRNMHFKSVIYSTKT